MIEHKSLEEYAAQNPQTQEIPQKEREDRAEYVSLLDRNAEAERLKAEVQQQLEAGIVPQAVLHTALSCIGILTSDREWTEATQAKIAAIYADLAQESFLEDMKAKEAERLQQQQSEYMQKALLSYRKQLADLDRLRRSVESAQRTIIEMLPDQDA